MQPFGKTFVVIRVLITMETFVTHFELVFNTPSFATTKKLTLNYALFV